MINRIRNHSQPWLALLSVILLALVFNEIVLAATDQEAKLLPSDGAVGDSFGISADIQGDTAFIGAFHDDDNGLDSGSVYVFVHDGTSWIQQAKLNPSDGSPSQRFGFDLALDEDTAVVGAIGDDDNGFLSGAAYVFIRDANGVWSQQAKLLPPDGAGLDQFGWSVALQGDIAAIGALADDDNGSSSGSVYVFVRNGTSWTLQEKILPSDGSAGDLFGNEMALDGDTLVVGAVFNNDFGLDSGSAYVFTFNGTSWSQQTKLLPSDGAPDDQFGNWMDIQGDTALIGARNDDDNGLDSGSAYVFVRNGTSWSEQAKLLPSDGGPGNWFGFSTTLEGDTAVIAALFDDDNGPDSGSAYIFTRSGTSWSQQEKLLPSDGMEGDFFGRSLALAGDVLIIGALSDDDNGTDSGSAYIFRLTPPTPQEAIQDLIGAIQDFNLDNGTTNSLMSNLQAALNVLNDSNTNNDIAAINSLQALINAVEARRGKQLTNEQADELVAAAQSIIDSLSGQ